MNAESGAGCLSSPKVKLIVLPWVLFSFAVSIYLVVVTVGLLSQLLRVSLPDLYNYDLVQGQSSSYDFQSELYYFRLEVNTAQEGYLLLGFMETSSGQFLLNRTLTNSILQISLFFFFFLFLVLLLIFTVAHHSNSPLETSVIVPLHIPGCQNLTGTLNLRIYVLISNVQPQTRESSSCNPSNVCISFSHHS